MASPYDCHVKSEQRATLLELGLFDHLVVYDIFGIVDLFALVVEFGHQLRCDIRYTQRVKEMRSQCRGC